ncbi:uncharacterized protein LOC113314265 isoform X5 [Papaver somniferum]|uniref:uncharacterized protein LOC113314265 isoform X5 n=1 Tax=Papaver somniferum TaxID=3469 RepID=UPI000E6FE0C7|nr:uncharacterized protein LOC113314265 isoform X5 [Papaver somniferum]
MRGLGFQKDLKFSWKSIYPMLISCIFVIISQLSLTLIPHYFSSSPLLLQLCFSVALLLIITVLCRIPKRLLKIYASAPAFVFFNIFFMWIVHNLVIRTSVSLVTNIVLNAECALLLFGFHSILYSDPGWVINEDSTSDQLIETEVIGTAYLEEEEVLRTEVKTIICCSWFFSLDLLLSRLLILFAQTNKLLSRRSQADPCWRALCLESWLSAQCFSHFFKCYGRLYFLFGIFTVLVSTLKLMSGLTGGNTRSSNYFIPKLLHPGQSYPEIGFINPYDKGVLANIKEILSPRT